MLPKITFEETGWRKSLAIYRVECSYRHRPGNYRLFGVTKKRAEETIRYVATMTYFANIHDLYELCEALELGAIMVVGPNGFDGRDILRMAKALIQRQVCSVESLAGLSVGPREIFGINKIYAAYVSSAIKLLNDNPIKNCRIICMISDRHLAKLDKMSDAYDLSRSAILEQIIDSYWYHCAEEY